MERIKVLEQFLRDDPDDPFNTYALALEYLKSEPEKASELFESLVRDKPEYIPTYYPYAQLLSETQDNRAEEIFKKGIETARRLNDGKAFKELSSAYNNWLFEQ
jgi:hypothetical protein